MVESDASHRGAPCGACGYRNRPGSNLCNLCGGYLYDRVPAPVDPRAGTGPLPVPPPLPAAPPPPPPPPPARRVPVAISLDGEADIYATPKTAKASVSLEPEAMPAEPEAFAAVEVEREPAAPLGSAPVPAAPPLRATAPPLRAAAAPLRAAQAPAPLPVRPASAPPRSMPLGPEGEDLASDVLQERLRRELATRRAWKAVGIAFVASTALAVPGSLQPISLLLNATGAVLYGFPVGYVACRQRLGMLGGGLLGALAGALYAVPLILLFSLFLPGGGAAWATQIARGALAGLLPGAWAGRRGAR